MPSTVIPTVEKEKTTSTSANVAGAWASLLGGKRAPNSAEKSATSPPKLVEGSGAASASMAKATTSFNPFAPAPGDALHPFFMTPEARKEHKIKEGQLKLQESMAKRQAELRAANSNNNTTSAAVNAFFAPRQKASPSSTSRSGPANPEIRAKFARYGSEIPDFPLISSTPALRSESNTVDSNSNPSTSLTRVQLEFETEDASSTIEAPDNQEYEILKRFARLVGIDSTKSNASSDDIGVKSEKSAKMSESPSEQMPDDEEILKIVSSVASKYDDVRHSLGMHSTKHPLKSSKPVEDSTEGVALLDVRAEDMAAFLAIQQQAAAQRQVDYEQRLLASKHTEPPYRVDEMLELYKKMIEQSKGNFSLPWSSRFAPHKSRFVCGNSKSAIALRDWCTRWKQASESGIEELPPSRSTTPVMVDFFKKKTTSSSSIKSSGSNLNGILSQSNSQNNLERNSSQNSDKSAIEGASDSLPNTFVLHGPVGSGKTSAVYAVAAELGFSVLEINASVKRSGASLRTMVEEATQSKHVGRNSSTMTILLFEEVDLAFAEDAGFFQTLVSLCESTKRPIVLTCQSIPTFLQSKLQSVVYQEMCRPDEASIFAHLSLACLASGIATPPPQSIVHQLVLWFDSDLRVLLNNVQIWAPLLSAIGWENTILALAGLVGDLTPPITLQDINSYLPSPFESSPKSLKSPIFKYSESKELPGSLDLLHRHLLSSYHRKNSIDKFRDSNMEVDDGTTPQSLRQIALALESIAISDTWHPSPLYDEADTTHDFQMELFSALQHSTLASIREIPDSGSQAANGSSDCMTSYLNGNIAQQSCSFSLGLTSQMLSVNQLVDGVCNVLLSKNASLSSYINRMDNITYLSLMANIEDDQRLLNTKRRQYKPKIDWSKVTALTKLHFVKALKFSSISSSSVSPRHPSDASVPQTFEEILPKPENEG